MPRNPHAGSVRYVGKGEDGDEDEHDYDDYTCTSGM